MPSKSKQQQKFFGVVKAMQKGDIPNKGEAGDVADDMDKKEVDKMTSTKHKGLPRKIKEMVLRELVQELKLNEVKPFRDEKLVSQFHDKTKNIFYLATNDHRYPTEIVLWDMPKKQFIFIYGQMGKFTSSSPTERVSANKLSKTHWVWPYHAAVAENQPFPGETMQQRIARTEKGWKGEGINEADRTSSISKQRAKAELKQQLKGKRADGLGDYTAIVYGMDGNDRVALKSMNDINNYSKFEIGNMEEGLNEAKNVKSLKANYEKAISLEQQLSSLMLSNLVKYKQAKASGDETAIAKFTKIAGQLSPKKRKATDDANAAYQAYEDAISGLHADAELELKEVDMKDDTEFTVSLKHLTKKHVTKGGEIEEANINWSTLHKDNQDYKYKKYATKAFDNISDAMFEFRHAMGIKQLGQADPKLKKRLDDMQAEIFALRRDMKSGGLTEGSLAEALARGLKPLLMMGSTIKSNVGEDALVKLSDKFEDIDDEQADDIASHLNMAIELMQDGYKGDATKKLKQFNKACADTLKGKPIKSAFENVNEDKLNEMDMNDPILVAIRARKQMLAKEKSAPKVKKLSLDQYWKKLEYRSYIEDQMKAAAKELEQLDSEMNQEAGQKGDDWSDADANRYGGDLDKLQTKVEKLAKLKVKVNKSIMDYRTS